MRTAGEVGRWIKFAHSSEAVTVSTNVQTVIFGRGKRNI